ncbi:MAG: DUF1353 domain-containing protein [Caulobacteraceae bacterium]
MSQFGAFDGPIDVRFDDNGRKVTLLAPAGFTGPDSIKWPVPAGAVVDGASIPRAFWSVIGGPFEGRYRDASVIHDHYCDRRTRMWKATHRVFYNGMRVRDVGAIQAKIMYYAVYHFGPRWPVPGLITLENFQITESVRGAWPTHRAIVEDVEDYRNVPEAAAAVAAIEATDPSLEEIEAMGL